MKPVSSHLLVLGLVALLGHFTAIRVEADGVPQQISKLQTTVNGIETKVDDVQTTVDNIPPAWSQTLPAAQRFVPVLGGAAELDKETGLVWEQSPATTIHTWLAARFECTSRTVGGRKGWRLPSVHELASLVDPNNPGGNPDLPPGHPFSSNVQSSGYWSATSLASLATSAWFVNLGTGGVGSVDKTDALFVWCVRGGMNADAY